MRGLLLKDLYCVRSYLKQMGFMLLIMFVIGIGTESPAMASFYAVFVGLSLLVSTLAADEKSRWEQYALTFPVFRKDIVKEKYILLIILACFSEMAAIISGLIVSSVSDGPSPMESIVSSVVVFVIYMYAYCIYVPAIYKMGTEKARYIFIAFLMIPLIIIVTLVGFFPEVFESEVADSTVLAVSAAACVVAGICLYISYRVSLRIYSEKEF